MHLANDVCRCVNGQCGEKEECLRWLLRDAPKEGMYWYATDLSQGETPCKSKLELKTNVVT